MVEVLNPGAFMRRDWAAVAAAAGPVLAVVLSQTGTSETSVAAVRTAREAGLPVVAVTAERGSPIAGVAERLLHLPVGPEPVGPKTKGYTASLVALFALADWLDGRERGPQASRQAVAALLGQAGAPAEALAARLDGLDFLAVIGEGRHFGTALEASLKVTEMAGLPAAAFPLEEALHGRLHGPSPRSLCLWIAADEGELRTAAHAAEVMAALGVEILVLNLTERSTLHDWLRLPPLLAAPLDTVAAILPFQRLAEALARRRGLPPHRMRFPGLSQRLGIKIERLP
jgi:glucosamine--fructose-6-phosphate aminotransferase (isomerizing)